MGTTRTTLWDRPSLAYLLAGLLAVPFYFALPSKAAQNAAYDLIGISAVAAILLGVRRHRPARRLPWYLLALGDALAVVGDLLWTYDEAVRGIVTPFPSSADALYLGGYVVFCAGVLALIRGQARRGNGAAAIDTAIITAGGGAFVWTFLIAPHMADSARPLLDRLVAGAYPAVDLLILVAAVRLALGLTRRPLALNLLLLALTTTFAADVLYAILTARGQYQTGHPVDAGWLLAYILHGALALHPSMRDRPVVTAEPEADRTLKRLPLLAAAALAGPALLALQTLRGARVEVPLIVGLTATLFLLALGRVRLLAGDLRRREARFHALIRHSSDIVATVDAAGAVRYVSPAVRRVLGYEPGECAGQPLLALVHPDDVAQTRARFARIRDQPGLAPPFDLRLRDRAGAWRRMEAVGTNLLDEPDVGGIVINCRDITERARAEEAQRFLAGAGERLSASLDLATTLDAVARLAVPALGDWCIIDLHHDDGTTERAMVHHADPTLAPVASGLRGRRAARPRPAPAAPLLRSSCRVGEVPAGIADEIVDDPARRESYRALGTEAYMIAPLLARSRSLGALIVVSADPMRRYDERDLALAADLGRRAALALDNTRLHLALVERERELQDLVGRLILAQEDERRQVAYDVHDGLAQLAASVLQHLRAFEYEHRPRSPREQHDLDQILNVAQQAVQEARRVIANLRPPALDDFGLGVAVRRQVEGLRAQGWQIDYRDGLGGERFPPTLETALFRVAQEALNNVRKHAGTTRVTIALDRTADAISLRVRDYGVGLAPGAMCLAGDPGERIGLRGMRERLTLLGGTLRIGNEPGGGAQVLARVPLGSRAGQVAGASPGAVASRAAYEAMDRLVGQ